MTLIFLGLNEFLVSRGSRGMITTLALSHCACAESPDVIKPLVISSGGIMVNIICTTKDENIFYGTIFREIQIIQSPWYVLNLVTLDSKLPRFLDTKTSGYLLKFDIKESPINITFAGDSCNKKLCRLNFSYQPSFPLLGTGITGDEISIEGLLQISSIDDKLSCC